MKNFVNIFKDLFYILRGRFSGYKTADYRYAFLVHSRNHKDLYRKYPAFKVLPKSVLLFIAKHLWPISLSRVTGLKNHLTGEEVKGYVLGITMTADQMMSDREYALKKIRQAVYLAKGKGANIIGLGGLSSSLSAGGEKLLDIDINITTGHGYTAYNVCQNLFKLTDQFGLSKEKVKVAVVGAAGSVGSTTSLLIARAGYKNIKLIDLRRKWAVFDELLDQIKKINPNANIDSSDSVSSIVDCDFVITATNAPEALITVDLVRDGMVIIDDAQPSDIAPDVLKLENVLVLEAGVVHTPGVFSNFNYGLKHRTDNFCCMAELLVLASFAWDGHYVIKRATLDHVDKISQMGEKLGFRLAEFQNFLESIPTSKIENVKNIMINKSHLK